MLKIVLLKAFTSSEHFYKKTQTSNQPGLLQ